jgi:photoactive yellow protein
VSRIFGAIFLSWAVDCTKDTRTTAISQFFTDFSEIRNMNGKHGDHAPIGPSDTLRWSRTYDIADMNNALSTMSADEIDWLPFGVIKVDRKGTILLYNAAERRHAGFDSAKVVGRNFFRDIAPCTNRPEFIGRFLEGVRTGRFDVTFRYQFSFPTQPVTVTVHLRNSLFDDAVWILIDWSADTERSNDQAPEPIA